MLLASSLIPGNENAIYGVINGLTRWGAQRRAQGQRQGARLRPRQRRRARLLLQHRPARATSCRCTASGGTSRPTPTWPSRPASRPPGGHRRGRRRRRPGRRPRQDHRQGRAGNVYVDGATVGGATEASLKDRRTLAEEGVVTVVAIVDADTGKLAEPPDFLVRGFVHDEHTFDPVVPLIEKALATAAARGHRRRPPARAADPRRSAGGPTARPPQPDHHPGRHRRLDLSRPRTTPTHNRRPAAHCGPSATLSHRPFDGRRALVVCSCG